MTVLYEQIIKLIFTALSLIFSSIVLPWIVTVGIPWLKERRLFGLIRKYVEGAEKKAHSGQISPSEKKSVVLTLLQAKGITITPEIDILVEAAVTELDNTAAHALYLVHEAFEEHSHGENGEMIIPAPTQTE